MVHNIFEADINHTSPAPDTVIEVDKRRENSGTDAVTIALILIIALGVWVFYQTATAGKGDPPMTEFFLLDYNDRLGVYPVEMQRPEQTRLVRLAL